MTNNLRLSLHPAFIVRMIGVDHYPHSARPYRPERISSLAEPENGKREILIDPEFVVRDSTGIARESRAFRKRFGSPTLATIELFWVTTGSDGERLLDRIFGLAICR